MSCASQFHAEHLRRFGFAAHSLRVRIEALRVEARCASIDAASLTMPEPAARAARRAPCAPGSAPGARCRWCR